MLGRPLQRFVCLLHHVELPVRHLLLKSTISSISSVIGKVRVTASLPPNPFPRKLFTRVSLQQFLAISLEQIQGLATHTHTDNLFLYCLLVPCFDTES